MPETKVINRVQPTRKKRGWTAADLSEQTRGSVPTSTIQKIERGAWTPNIKTALLLADALDASVDRLFLLESSHTRLKGESE